MVSRRDFSLEMMWKFPKLRDYKITSDSTHDYNCIAWAAGEDDRWWEPIEDAYWPDEAPKSMSPKALEAAYATRGFAKCTDGTLEPDYERIALFVNDGKWTHAARQLTNGRWTSKMGFGHDIEHDLATMDGGGYGKIVTYMRRPRPVSVDSSASDQNAAVEAIAPRSDTEEKK